MGYLYNMFSSSFQPLINRLDIAGFSDWLASYSVFVLPTIFLSTLISLSSNICLIVYVSALLSSAYVIIGRADTLYIFTFCFFSHIFVSPGKIIQTASHSCCFLSLASFYQVYVFSMKRYSFKPFHTPL